jgi:hypothetical protein
VRPSVRHLLRRRRSSEERSPRRTPKSDAAPAAPAAAAGSASITGKVSFEGTVPPGEKVKLNADPKCAEMHKDSGGLERQPLHVKDGGLADVLVYVKSPVSGSYPPPTEAVTLIRRAATTRRTW